MIEAERLERLKRRFEGPEAERIAAGRPVSAYSIRCDAEGCSERIDAIGIADLAHATEGWHVGLDVGFPDDCPGHVKR